MTFRASFAGVVFAALLAGCGGSRVEGVSREHAALVRSSGNVAGGAVVGDWRGLQGIDVHYREGARLAVAFQLRNRAPGPVTITAVESLDRPARLLHPIGIRLTRFKQPACAADTLGCQFPLSLRRPFGPTAPKPLVVPRGFQAGVQLNFEVGGCTRAAPGLRETVNRAVLVRYTVGGQRQETRINLHGIQLHIAAPPLGACLRLP